MSQLFAAGDAVGGHRVWCYCIKLCGLAIECDRSMEFDLFNSLDGDGAKLGKLLDGDEAELGKLSGRSLGRSEELMG